MTLIMGLTIISNIENNDINIYWAPTPRHHAEDLKPTIPLDPDNTHSEISSPFPHFTDTEADAENS